MEMDMENLTFYFNEDLNFTEYESHGEDHTDMNIQSIVIHSVLLYIGLCTNIWMIWSLYKTWEKGSRAHFYLLALCIADIFLLSIVCSVDIGSAVTISWKGGQYGCTILMALRYFGPILAHLILTGFNIDNAITIIINRSVKAIRVAFLVSAVVLTVMFCVPMGYFAEVLEYESNFFVCTRYFPIPEMWWVLNLAFAVGEYFIPLFFMLFCGGPALCVWCGKKGTINYQKMSQEEGTDIGMKNIGKDIGMITAYNILFLLCWTPEVVMTMSGLTAPTVLYFAVYYVSIANSCLNPIIYAVFSCIYKRRGNVSQPL